MSASQLLSTVVGVSLFLSCQSQTPVSKQAPPQPTVASSSTRSMAVDAPAPSPSYMVTSANHCHAPGDCPVGELCCEEMGTAMDPVCIEPRRGEPFPCGGRELCSEQHPCSTERTQCVDGRCEVEPRQSDLRCGDVTCVFPSNICLRDLSGGVECTQDANLNGDGYKFTCTGPSDCVKGEFCVLGPMSTWCEHEWDGVTEIFCEAVEDCPAKFRDLCDNGKSVTCAAPEDNRLILPGLRSCTCD